MQWRSDSKRPLVRIYRGVSSRSDGMRCRPTERVQTDPAFRRRRRSRGVFKIPCDWGGLSPFNPSGLAGGPTDR